MLMFFFLFYLDIFMDFSLIILANLNDQDISEEEETETHIRPNIKKNKLPNGKSRAKATTKKPREKILVLGTNKTNLSTLITNLTKSSISFTSSPYLISL